MTITTRFDSPTPPNPPQKPTAVKDPLPRSLGRYTLTHLLGEGGMGRVYRAYDPNFETTVAIKVPHAALMQALDFVERFYREARVLARLTHPNVCRVFDVNEIKGQHYIAMALVEGKELSPDLLASTRGIVEIARVLALTLGEVHEHGVIHRDLKPANILITPKGAPVIMDFGLVLEFKPDEPPSEESRVLGTLPYMSPEQIRGEVQSIGPRSDIFSLGIVLFELLTGRRPFLGKHRYELICMIGDPQLMAAPPSRFKPDIDRRLDEIVLKALAKPLDLRFPNMPAFAEALREYLEDSAAIPTTAPGSAPAEGDGPRPEPRTRWWQRVLQRIPGSSGMASPLPLSAECIGYEFVGHGAAAPLGLDERDQLYLDVGNDLRAGVIDHHQASGSSTSTAGLVLANSTLVAASVKCWRKPGEPFTIVLHRDPDLDGLAAAYLASSWLTMGSFPNGAAALARYVDAADSGEAGISAQRPFTLYAAFAQLKHRLGLSSWNSKDDMYRECVQQGIRLVDFVLKESIVRGCAIPEIDAFQAPGLFSHLDRREVLSDFGRYRSKLADPHCQARRAEVQLPALIGGTAPAPALIVRDVQNGDDPDRVIFFKDWARGDAELCPEMAGFVALVVSMVSASKERRVRTILSVRPNAGVTLKGLGAKLDAAEGERRRQLHGFDDRVEDAKTRTPLPPRSGYDNSDPWYDGRAHEFTIVDSPRSGTCLSVDEVERLFLEYGHANLEDVQKV